MKGYILITGASRGIGKATAIYLSNLGYQVFAGVRKEEDVKELAKLSQSIIPVIIDITKRETMTKAFDQISDMTKGAGLTALINNAAIGEPGPLEYFEETRFHLQMEVNLFGQLTITQIFLPLIRIGQGRIVFIGSMGGWVANPLLGAYCASKFALRGMVDALRMELRSSGVLVTMVDPGSTATSLWDTSLEKMKAALAALPMEGKVRYESAMQYALNSFQSFGRTSAATESVAKVISCAVLARRPRKYYLAGKDAKMLVLFSKILPWRMLDDLMCQAYGFPVQKGHFSLAAIWQKRFGTSKN